MHNSKLYKFIISYSLREKWQVFMIVALSIRATLILTFLPLRKYFQKFFIHADNQVVNLTPHNRDIKLIKKVLKSLPWKHSCLKESIIVHLYLRKRGIIAPIRLGIDIKSDFKAHAWIDLNELNNFYQFEIHNAKENKEKEKVGNTDH